MKPIPVKVLSKLDGSLQTEYIHRSQANTEYLFLQGNALMKPIPVKVLDKLDGSYHIEYNATIPGKYSMAISIIERDIPGSPFMIEVQKGFNLPHFNTSWGLNMAGDAGLVSLQGPLECLNGDTGCVSAVRLTQSEINSTGECVRKCVCLV